MNVKEIFELPVTDPNDSTVGDVVGAENVEKIQKIVKDLLIEAEILAQLDLIRRLRSSYGYGAFGLSLKRRRKRLEQEIRDHYAYNDME